MSPSIDFYNNFSHPSSANAPRVASIGLLKSRQNPSVQALFGECRPDLGIQLLDVGVQIQDLGVQILDLGAQILDLGTQIPDYFLTIF